MGARVPADSLWTAVEDASVGSVGHIFFQAVWDKPVGFVDTRIDEFNPHSHSACLQCLRWREVDGRTRLVDTSAAGADRVVWSGAFMRMVFMHGIGRDGLALALIATPSTLVAMVFSSCYLGGSPPLLAEFMRQWVPMSGLYIMICAFCSTVQLLRYPGSLEILPQYLWFRELDWVTLIRAFDPDVKVIEDVDTLEFHCRGGVRVFAERSVDCPCQIVTGVLYGLHDRCRYGCIGRLYDDALFLRTEFLAGAFGEDGFIETTISTYFIRAVHILCSRLHITKMAGGASLVWSLESVILGLWAVVFSVYSTPLHAFVARCHVLAASFTLLLHLVASARSLDVVAWAASQAFLCLVSALCVCYCVALADPNNKRYFSLPLVDGLLPLDAFIGISWLLAALVSSVGMALVPFAGRKSSLMLHHCGYHLVVMAPSILLLLPSSTVFTFVWILAWILHVLIILGVTAGGTDNRSALLKALTFFGRLACVAIASLDVVFAGGSMRFVVSVVLLVISVLDQFDWIGSLEDVLKNAEGGDAPMPTTTGGQPIQSRDPAAVGLIVHSTRRRLSP